MKLFGNKKFKEWRRSSEVSISLITAQALLASIFCLSKIEYHLRIPTNKTKKEGFGAIFRYRKTSNLRQTFHRRFKVGFH